MMDNIPWRKIVSRSAYGKPIGAYDLAIQNESSFGIAKLKQWVHTQLALSVTLEVTPKRVDFL
ncbi:hypothetical protein HYFRA_00007546 [Hymenoscyphus fraxineus]|uniref:Uncharacterized protein n=1 Tax=Hymenoscyphus fraxineus TaxID=746836 RepID=A0A9N9KTW1_9HELO|nr:hypothetical protein HYFRA_00007546 [Hymenoscyphus fraxineus]